MAPEPSPPSSPPAQGRFASLSRLGILLLLLSVGQGYADDQRSNLVQRLKGIIIPESNFREAKPSDIFVLLSDESRRLDPEHLGVNIIDQADSDEMKVTISLHNVPLWDAMNYVRRLAGLSYRIEPNAVIIFNAAAGMSNNENSKSLIAQGTSEPTFVETHDLNSGSYRGHASISVEASTVTLGKEYAIHIQFFNDGGSNYFFNPDLHGLVPIPAYPVIYDINKKYIGKLWQWMGGSQRGVEAGDWKLVPTGSHVDFNWKFTAGYVPGVYDGGQHLLPAGEYYIQFIYYKAFVSPRPFDPDSDNPSVEEMTRRRAFYDNFYGTELFRSNVIKIRFVAPSAKGDDSGP
jgi:hypothetical protein